MSIHIEFIILIMMEFLPVCIFEAEIYKNWEKQRNVCGCSLASDLHKILDWNLLFTKLNHIKLSHEDLNYLLRLSQLDCESFAEIIEWELQDLSTIHFLQ